MNTEELFDIDDELEVVTCILERLSFEELSKISKCREESEALERLEIFHFAIQCNGFVSLYDQTVQPRCDWLGIEHFMRKIGASDSFELFQKARKIYFSGDQFPDSSENFKSVIWSDPDGAEAQKFYEVAEEAENAFYFELIPKLVTYFRQNWELFRPLIRQ